LKTVISGDTLFRGAIGRTDLADGDFDALIKNIREQIFTLPGDTIIIPGHGEITTVAHEKQFNRFLQS
jgi:glyoxylase-like metal-dependent hydrolase (beta-lactamase superfamily II)